jgi:hypothetical protein
MHAPLILEIAQESSSEGADAKPDHPCPPAPGPRDLVRQWGLGSHRAIANRCGEGSIRPGLVRYPAIDPEAFREKVEAFLAEVGGA